MDSTDLTIIERDRSVEPKNTTGSRQPRLDQIKGRGNMMFGSSFEFKTLLDPVPPYQADSRARDMYLSQIWHKEPHLAGVVNSVVAIDKNRGWQLTGGRNQVSFYEKVLRYAENGKGWRYFCSLASEAFWTTDINAIVETERESLPGRMLNLFHVDPTRCRLLGGATNELEFTPPGGKAQRWVELKHFRDGQGRVIATPADYFRIASLPNINEEFNGLGFSAVSRCIELVQIMAAVWKYDQEKLGARMPQGLLLLHNVDQEQWQEALRSRDADLRGKEQQWFGSVATLASAGVDQIEAKLVALSELPDNFNRQNFIDLTMFAYALCFGYDQTEFWPVNAGIMGRGRETEIQHRKATGKGGLDFALSMQDQMQMQMPDTVHFGIEQRDVEGEMLDAELNKTYVDMVVSMYMAENETEGPLLTKDQALSVLATHSGIIPKAWTEIEEEAVGTDTEASRRHARAIVRELPQVIRSAERYPSDPIVQFRWPTNTMVILWESGDDMLRPVNYRGIDTTHYRSKNLTITAEDVAQALG